MAHILPNTDQGLITADNSVVVFIDHQPQMLFGVGSGIDRQQLVNNVVLLARGAKEYNVPTILTTVETESFSGQMWPQLLDVFPEQQPIERTGMNSVGHARIPRSHQGDGEKEHPIGRFVDGGLHRLAYAADAR